MTRRQSEDDAPPPADQVDTLAVIPGDMLPSDAEALETVIDRRFKALLSMATDPKDLTKALEAATKWWEAKQGREAEDGYGSALRRTTRNE